MRTIDLDTYRYILRNYSTAQIRLRVYDVFTDIISIGAFDGHIRHITIFDYGIILLALILLYPLF